MFSSAELSSSSSPCVVCQSISELTSKKDNARSAVWRGHVPSAMCSVSMATRRLRASPSKFDFLGKYPVWYVYAESAIAQRAIQPLGYTTFFEILE